MASSSAASKRKRARAESPVSEDPEVLDSSPVTPKKKLCTVCGVPANLDIEKDGNYDAMMQLYWCTLGIDVKPELCNKTDSCKKCFDKIVKYFETNDIIVYFENYFKSLREELLKKTLKGLGAWEKEGKALNRIQQMVLSKYGPYGDYKEPEEHKIVKHTLDGYKVECYDIMDDEDEDGETPRKGIKITKNSEEPPSNKKGSSKISLKATNNQAEDSEEMSDDDDYDDDD